MALLNSGHLIWWLRQRIAEEPNPATRNELTLTVDQAALELNADNDDVRRHAIARVLELAHVYDHAQGYREEWGRKP